MNSELLTRRTMKRPAEGPESPFDKVLAVLEASGDFRTVGGIARDSGLSRLEVERVICEHPSMFAEGPVRIGGEAVYALHGVLV